MSQTFGPHRPQKGYPLRWLVQSVALLSRLPVFAVLFLVAVFVNGLLIQIMGEAIDSRISQAAATCLLAGLNTFLVMLAIDATARADNAGGLPVMQVAALARGPAIATVIIGFVMTFLAIFALPAPEITAAQIAESRAYGFLSKTFILGQRIVVQSLIPTFMISAFWLPLRWDRGISIRDMLVASSILFMRFPSVAVFVNVFFFNIVFLSLYAAWFISLPVLMLMIVWSYVATREVFGGISSNGKQEAGREYALAEASR